MSTKKISEAYLVVDVGGGAIMTYPCGELEWQMRYGDAEKFRFIAASALASYAHLICFCNKEEAWRRIKAMRAARKRFPMNPEAEP